MFLSSHWSLLSHHGCPTSCRYHGHRLMAHRQPYSAMMQQKKACRQDRRSKATRAANVKVVAAPDADAGLGAAVLGSLALSPAPPASPAINTDIHHSCNAVEPPPRKNTKQRGPVNWVKCDACPCGHAGTTQFAWGYGTLQPCISLWDVQLLGLKTVRNFAYSTFSTTAKFFLTFNNLLNF